MARTRRPSPEKKAEAAIEVTLPPQIQDNDPPPGGFDRERPPETTGRYVIVYRKDALESPKMAIQSLSRVAGIKDVVSAADFDEEQVDLKQASDADALYLPSIGVAVVSADDAQLQNLMAASNEAGGEILVVEPEYVYYALAETASPMEYLRGYRDAVNHLYEKLAAITAAEADLESAAFFQDTGQFTWGMQATRVNSSKFTGRGVKVAILDTGLDLKHKDFRGRKITSQSFIPGQAVQDVQGHGTHCTGTACGAESPASGVRRYGCAHEADIFIGKVLGDNGRSVGSSVLSGMNWAVANRCQVISMSLGSDVNLISQAFEQIGRRSLTAGCLIVAAAGNNAERSLGNMGFVGQPANSPSIMAVGAIDNRLRVADFSARSSSMTGTAGKVDISGPGVNIFSSSPGSRHVSWSGTSMATPHVAGIAALWCQATGRTGAALWTLLTQNARSIRGDLADIGVGLIQAPQ